MATRSLEKEVDITEKMAVGQNEQTRGGKKRNFKAVAKAKVQNYKGCDFFSWCLFSQFGLCLSMLGEMQLILRRI